MLLDLFSATQEVSESKVGFTKLNERNPQKHKFAQTEVPANMFQVAFVPSSCAGNLQEPCAPGNLSKIIPQPQARIFYERNLDRE